MKEVSYSVTEATLHFQEHKDREVQAYQPVDKETREPLTAHLVVVRRWAEYYGGSLIEGGNWTVVAKPTGQLATVNRQGQPTRKAALHLAIILERVKDDWDISTKREDFTNREVKICRRIGKIEPEELERIVLGEQEMPSVDGEQGIECKFCGADLVRESEESTGHWSSEIVDRCPSCQARRVCQAGFSDPDKEKEKWEQNAQKAV